MTFLLMVLVLLMVAGVTSRAGIEIHSRAAYSLPRSKVKSLSWPAKEIVKAYYDLPKDSQRYGNLYYMLSALDTKYGKDAVNRHFMKSGYDHTVRTFNVCRPSTYRSDEGEFTCGYREYHNMKQSIDEISAAHKDRMHAIQMAGVAGGLDAVKEFTKSLREERDLINETTKELT